jgi:hypothetical protein
MTTDGQLVARTVGELRASLPQEGDLPVAVIGQVSHEQELEIEGRASMSKDELIAALPEHAT